MSTTQMMDIDSDTAEKSSVVNSIEIQVEEVNSKDNRSSRTLPPDKSSGKNIYVPSETFPKLRSLEKLSRMIHQNEDDSGNPKDLILLKLIPEWSLKLIDLQPPLNMYLGEKLTTLVRSHLMNESSCEIVLQNQKNYQDLNDSQIEADLPVCVLKVEKSESPREEPKRIAFDLARIEYPVEAQANFRGVRLIASNIDLGLRHDFHPVWIQCGTISHSLPNDRYKDIVLTDLFATMGFWSALPMTH